jgi:hypothetical protein
MPEVTLIGTESSFRSPNAPQCIHPSWILNPHGALISDSD